LPHAKFNFLLKDEHHAQTYLVNNWRFDMALFASMAYRHLKHAHSTPHTEQHLNSQESTVLPVMTEHIEVGKRTVDTARVLVHKRVRVQEQRVDSPILHQVRVDITRRPVNQPVQAITAVRTEGDVTIVPVHEEVWVTTKQLMLKEELHIRRHLVQREPQTHTMQVHHEEVEIVREPLYIGNTEQR
jgi:stress response protein YsnF